MINYDLTEIESQLSENFNDKAPAILALIMGVYLERGLDEVNMITYVNQLAQENREPLIPIWLYTQSPDNKKVFCEYLADILGQPQYHNENWIYVGRDTEGICYYANIEEYIDLITNAPKDVNYANYIGNLILGEY